MMPAAFLYISQIKDVFLYIYVSESHCHGFYFDLRGGLALFVIQPVIIVIICQSVSQHYLVPNKSLPYTNHSSVYVGKRNIMRPPFLLSQSPV